MSPNTLGERAVSMIQQGFTPIPLRGKVPQLQGWQTLLSQNLTALDVVAWDKAGLLQNLGMVCGAASKNTVVIDFDGMAGYRLFVERFPELAETLTVRTGSGKGMHVYFQVDLLPDSRKVMDIPLEGGDPFNIELKSNGTQVVIPPSIHPDTQQPYIKCNEFPIRHITDLEAVWQWALSLKPGQTWQPPASYNTENNLNPALIREIQSRLEAQGFKRHGDWINTSCPNAAAHKHGDRTPSFGFNTVDGGANCYRCGGMSLKTLCGYLNLDPAQYGGFYEKSEALNVRIATSAGFDPAKPDTPLPIVKRSERLTAFTNRIYDYDTPRAFAPVIFPLKALHSLGGMAHISKPGKLLGIVGVSGGGKTSLLESMVDSWLDYDVPSLVWSPEWNADEFIERAVQRYGGATTAELYLHELYIHEKQNGQPHRAGVELTPEKMEASNKALRKLRGWQTEVGYLDMPFLTIANLRNSIGATLAAIDFKPRVLVIDYVQLLLALDTTRDLNMYNLLMQIKAVCAAHNLLGVVATQVTKTSAKDQSNGKLLDSMDARYVNDDAFNLFVTINPDRDSEKNYMPSAVLNVSKNSMGQRGKVRVGVNWERLAFETVKHPNQDMTMNQEVEF